MNLRALLSWGILPWLIACLAALILITVRTLQAHGWPPCELCLRQRVPYWVALPLALGAGVAGLPSLSLNPIFSRLLMLAAGITFLVGAGLAVQHIGVEQGWWLSK